MFNQKKSSTSKTNYFQSFEILVLLLVLGWLILALVDAQYRDSFVNIAEFGVGCFLGWMIPKPIFKGKT